ncbi:MAG TPA: Gfo/Idh/MocA family oxidoreductase [Terrimicrobiaceae bacterium]|mgnify:CR=1 FL=1|nr:Gfo/Idh/MocA family oxidoreductase [Terrimicrobiaceae bacterium]
MKKRRYVAVGTGGRITMFIDPIVSRFKDDAELVGMCDPSATRRSYHQQRLSREYGIGPVPVFEDFDRMLAETKPDVVIVCTPDYLHHEYIVRSLDFGADVISEKPLTTDAGKCRAIMEAVARTGGRVRTTFNMRWSPGVTKVRELIAQGAIGRVRHVDFEYLLNTSHGADYFRRWHSHKEFSGGLLLHKSTHHFDVLNWWIDGIPETVFAMGGLVFYGKKNAIERGQEELTRYDRYTGRPESEGDPFRLAIDQDPTMRALYYEAEADSGYIRDQNVFRDGIDIEDSMSVMVKYRTGVMLSYSLNAYCPREGFRASISGDGGRIEYEESHASHIVTGGKEIGSNGNDHFMRLRLQKLFSAAEDIPIQKLEGGHGGGDPLIQEQMFSQNPPADALGRNAGHEQGAASLLIGAAANESMRTGQPVSIVDLAPLKPSARHLHELI